MMDAGNTFFVDVDTQVDFCLPSGRLAVADAPVEAFIRLTELAVETGIPVVGSVDAHPFDDSEFETFPPHCVVGTIGQIKVRGTLPTRSRFVGDHDDSYGLAESLREGEIEAVYFEKQSFSIFSTEHAADVIDGLGRTTAVVYGVATDYCVKAAVLGLCERGYEVIVISDAVAGVAPETVQAAWVEMAEAGAKFRTEAWLRAELGRKAA